MPYEDAQRARECARKSAARHLAKFRDSINARRRRNYRKHLAENRAALRVRMRERYHTIPEHKAKVLLAGRAKHLWVCFRLTMEEYDKILAFQNGVCAGCGEPPRKVRLAVDHEHKTGRIRGLLCWLCNRAIGLLRDKGHAATNLGQYLHSPTAPVALGKETYGLIGRAKATKKVKVYGGPQS